MVFQNTLVNVLAGVATNELRNLRLGNDGFMLVCYSGRDVYSLENDTMNYRLQGPFWDGYRSVAPYCIALNVMFLVWAIWRILE